MVYSGQGKEIKDILNFLNIVLNMKYFMKNWRVNAGLFATNLINAFHSLGIGTCLIQFSNKIEEEEELKKLNQIPSYERIAVILFAGYYDEKSIFPVSSRKSVEEYFKEHK